MQNKNPANEDYRRDITEGERKKLATAIQTSGFAFLSASGVRYAQILTGDKPVDYRGDFCSEINKRMIGHLGSRYVRLIGQKTEVKQQVLELIADTLSDQD